MAKILKDGRAVKASRLKRTIKRIIITVIVLLVMFVAWGLAYVYVSGRHTPEEAVPAPAVVKEESPLPKAVPPSPNSPVGAAVSSLTTPVKVGSNASLTVQTNAGSKCTVEVTYGGVLSKDSGLTPKAPNDYGSVTWTWTVPANTPVGKAPIKVTCVFNGRSGVVATEQVVTN